jgi:hypothetical protein
MVVTSKGGTNLMANTNDLVIEITENFSDPINVSSMGITNINDVQIMYSQDGLNWEFMSINNPTGGIVINYTPSVVNSANPLETITFSNLPTDIVSIVIYRLTDLSKMPQFTSGNLHLASVMNQLVDITKKGLEEARGSQGSIQTTMTKLISAKNAAEQYANDSLSYANG